MFAVTQVYKNIQLPISWQGDSLRTSLKSSENFLIYDNSPFDKPFRNDRCSKLSTYLRPFPLYWFGRWTAKKQRFVLRREFWIHEQLFFFFAMWLQFAVTLIQEIMKLSHSFTFPDGTIHEFPNSRLSGEQTTLKLKHATYFMHESYPFNNSVGKVRAVKDWVEFEYLEHV